MLAVVAQCYIQLNKSFPVQTIEKLYGSNATRAGTLNCLFRSCY